MRHQLATAGLTVLMACRPFSSPDGPPATDAGAASNDPAAVSDASTPADASVGDAGTTAKRPCASRTGLLLCEDFEKFENGVFSGWGRDIKPDTGRVQQEARDDRGGGVLRSSVDSATAYATLQRNVVWKGLPEIWSRVFVYLPAPLDGDTANTLLMYSGMSSDGVEIDLRSGKLVVNQFGGTTIYETATTAFPIREWVCLEWKLASLETTLWANGVVAAGKASIPLILDHRELHLGLSRENGSSMKAEAVLFDDFAVASTRIGCD